MKVYLDTSCLQRPLDSRTQVRISLEAEAMVGVIALIEDSEVELVSSDVLLFETRRNPRYERRAYALDILAKASMIVRLDESIRRRAAELEARGLKPLDALHLASAEAAKVEYFCTADDKLLERGKANAKIV